MFRIFALVFVFPLALSISAAEEAIPSLLGSWEGELIIGPDASNLAFTFTEQDGQLRAALVSSAMGIFGMPAEEIELDGLRMEIRIPRIDGVFTGRIRLDEAGAKVIRIDGDWFQYAELLPITLLPVDAPSF